MTQEEKAKAYDEALERARIWQNHLYDTNDRDYAYELNYIFPELKESEDERVRKALLELVHDTTGDELWVDYNVHKEDALAWLEKQGEQRYLIGVDLGDPDGDKGCRFDYSNATIQQKDFAPKVEPKFKVGDWITNGDYTWEVTDIKVLDYVLRAQNGNIVDDTISYTDEQFNLWTIQDAKDGDVLIDKSGSRECPFIFKETKPSDIKTNMLNPLAVLGYCGIGGAGFAKGSGWGDTANCIYYPATKEQCDILFKRMHEFGYEWNAKRKILKKIEQKSAEKIEPKFKIDDWVTCEELNTAKILNINNDRYEIEFIDGYKGFPHIDYVDRLFHLWSIKDAKDGDVLASELCDSIILFRGIKDDNIDFYCDYDFSKIDIPGDRFTVNNGQHYGNVEDSKDFYPATKEQRDTLFSKMHEAGYEWNAEKKELKKIEQKPYSWKPTKEQFEALDYAYNSCSDTERGNYYEGVLESLIEDLHMLEKQGEQNLIMAKSPQLGEQKPAWSEEDERILDALITSLNNEVFAGRLETLKSIGVSLVIDWLKSLKDRIKG